MEDLFCSKCGSIMSLDIEKSNNVAFELAKQEEKVRVNNELFWSKIKLLK